MKQNNYRLLVILSIIVLSIIGLSSCSGSNMDGHYIGEINDDPITIDIEGDNVVIPYDYGFSIGKVDTENKVFNLSNSKSNEDPTDVYQYEIVNGNLVVTIWGSAVTFTKEKDVHAISSLDGSYYLLNSDYCYYLDIKGSDVLYTSDGVGFKYSLDDKTLSNSKNDESYSIDTVYSALILSDDDYYRFCFFKDDSVKEITTLTGKYIQKTEYAEDADKLEIDEGNGTAIITLYDEDYLGKINTKDKRVSFDSLLWDCPYEIYNNKIAIGDLDWGNYYVFEKDDNASNNEKAETEESATNNEDKKQYKYTGHNDYIPIGEYMVGTDIKPGTYVVSFEYFDLDEEQDLTDEEKNGAVIFYKDGNEVSRTEFSDLDEQSIVFEEGMKVKFDSSGKDSEFNINAN